MSERQQVPGSTTGTGGIEQEQYGAEQEPTTLSDVLTDDMRLVLHDSVQAKNVCEWCADECIREASPEMVECVRLCRDVADLAELNATFIARGSAFGPEIAEAFAIAAEECARECSRHEHSHCRECARVLERAVDSTWSMLGVLDEQRTQQAP